MFCPSHIPWFNYPNVTCRGYAWLVHGVLDSCTFKSELQATTALPLFPHFTGHRWARTRVVSLRQACPGNRCITVWVSLQIPHKVFLAPLDSFPAIILQLPVPKTRLSSIPLLPSSYPARLASRNSTRQNWTLPCNHFSRTTQKTQPLYFWEGSFTVPLHSNGSYWIVACVFVAADGVIF
jgi:hypothetical protein